MRRNKPKHIDVTAPKRARRQRIRAIGHAIGLFVEVTILMVAFGLIAYMISRTMIQAHDGISWKAERMVAQRNAERVFVQEHAEPDDGRSPIYVDHLKMQDKSWQPMGNQ